MAFLFLLHEQKAGKCTDLWPIVVIGTSSVASSKHQTADVAMYSDTFSQFSFIETIGMY